MLSTVLLVISVRIWLLHSNTVPTFYVHSFNFFIKVQHPMCKCEQECQLECVLQLPKLILIKILCFYNAFIHWRLFYSFHLFNDLFPL